MTSVSSHYRRRGRFVFTLGLFFLALLVRSWRALQTTVVNPDAIRFIEQGRRFSWDALGAVRSEVYHPLHSLAGLAVHSVVGRYVPDDRAAWLISLQIVGVICGSIVAVEIVAIARLMGAPFWAGVGAGFCWIVGRRTSAYGADGISDMLFLSLFGGAMIVGMCAMRFRKGHLTFGGGVAFFATGVLAGLAYLTRPEGLAAPLIFSIALLLPLVIRIPRRSYALKLLPRRQVPFPSILMAMSWMLTGTALLAAPYMAAIGGVTLKKPLFLPTTIPAAASVVPVNVGILPAIGKMSMELWETFGFGPYLTVLLVIPFAPRLWGRPRLRFLVFVWIFTWTGVMFWLIHRAQYLDGRHTLPLQLVLHGILALAFVHWQDAMRLYMYVWDKHLTKAWYSLPAWLRSPRWPMITSGCAIFLAALPGMIKLKSSPVEDRLFLHRASEWVRSSLRDNVVVYEHGLLVGYYSGHPYQRFSLSPQTGLPLIPPKAPQHVILLTYFTDEDGVPPLRIGPYVAIAAFHSNTAAHGDLLIIYSLPNADIMKNHILHSLDRLPSFVPATSPQHPSE